MTSNHIAVPALVFNGVEIHDRSEKLSLTDMWRAAGSDHAREPAKWLSSADAARFIEAVAVILGNSEDEMVKTVRGGRTPGTWAHWQIALAYAKYLSPEFHMQCNVVIRERMEGKPSGGLPPEVLEMIRRDGGISRMLAHKVTEQGKVQEEQSRALAVIGEAVNALVAIVQPSVPGVVIRHGRTAGAILKANGFTKCPMSLGKWFGNRLEAAGCRVEGRVDTGVCRARLFDPDKAEAWLKNGGRASVEMKLAERRGQGALALTGPRNVPAPRGEPAFPIIPSDIYRDGVGAIFMDGVPVFFDIKDTKIGEGDRAVVVTAAGDVKVDTPRRHYDPAHQPMGPRSAMASPQMEAVPGRRDPIPVEWACVILGKVLERNNVVRLPA